MLIESMLGGFERKAFPVESCVTPNEREPEVLESNVRFLCVIVDKRFDEATIRVLLPYVCPDAEDPNKTLFGWVTPDRMNVYDHFENDIHGDPNRVVAWRRVDAGDPFFTDRSWE